MIQIPKQLQNPDFRFCKISKEEKKPVEKEWQSTKNYSFDDSSLLEWIGNGNNYGIVGGFGNLLIVDFDDLSLYEKVKKILPDTFSVMTGSGKFHYYYICDDVTSAKAGGGKIDLQGKGKQAVAPGSIHPNGNQYAVFQDLPIASMNRSEINSILNPKKEEPKQEISVANVPAENYSVDVTDSGKTFGRVMALLKEGYEKEQIYSLMEQKKKVKDAEGKVREEFIWQKWHDRADYREMTYNNALKEYLREGDSYIPFLKKPELLEVLDAELDKKIVDEQDSRKVILLVALGGSLTINCSPTSTNLMVNDASGAGKDYICKSVLDLLPKHKVIARKRISEKVFTYWHNSKFEPEWSWSGKIFYNEDVGNSLLNCDVFKVMSSSDGVNNSTIIIKQQLVEIVTIGKPVMLITIACAHPKDELLRRYPILNLNTTEDQTRKIIHRKAQFHKFGSVPGYDESISKALGYLKRVKVRVPYADRLEKALDTSHIIIRTHFDRFMDLIKFSCAIHQYQRKEEASYLVAEKQDYEIASQALLKTTSNIFSVPLTKNQQKVLDVLRKLRQNLFYSVSELEKDVTFISDRTLRIELDKLTEWGFLAKDKQSREESSKPVMVYRLNKISQIGLPSWAQIENSNNSRIAANDIIDSNASDTSNASNGGAFEANEPNELTIDNEDLQIDEEKIR